ncbi:type II secretion system F family protein [Vallitalea okinawensis]|uniref:type II secretion system F family protein n=1 Tax=Vallitalea okinawensis TaxID=2078660 RepID=UPI000CFC0840|nr:type II secretion system F family protein [Vallitalea okinawensis]
MILIALLLTFLCILTLSYAILFSIAMKGRPVDALKYYDKDFDAIDKMDGHKSNITILKSLSKLIPRITINKRRRNQLELDLIKADIPLKVEELQMLRFIISLLIAFTGYSITYDSILSLIIFIIIWMIPRIIINRRKNKRLLLFNEQINEAVMIISNSLKAGYSFLQALSVVVEETEDPLSKEFKRLLKEMRLGASTEDAFNNMLKRIDSEDLKLIVNAILIQKDIGGKLSEILDNIAETIRERQKIQMELKTLTAQGKLSGLIIMLIPVFLGVILYLFNRELIMLLFTTTMGITMLVTAVVNQFIGLVIIRKIVTIEM